MRAMPYDAEQARAALAAFQASTGLRDFPWEKAAGVAERVLWKFRDGQTASLSRGTYAKLAAGASRLLGRPVSEAELRGEIPPQRLVGIAWVVGTGGAVLPLPRLDVRDTPIPPGLDGCRAIRISGDAGAPMFESGDVIFVAATESPLERHVGRVAIVKVKDGAQLLKRVLRGTRRDRFDLVGVGHGGEALGDQELEHVEPIRWIMRNG